MCTIGSGNNNWRWFWTFIVFSYTTLYSLLAQILTKFSQKESGQNGNFFISATLFFIKWPATLSHTIQLRQERRYRQMKDQNLLSKSDLFDLLFEWRRLIEFEEKIKQELFLSSILLCTNYGRGEQNKCSDCLAVFTKNPRIELKLYSQLGDRPYNWT